MTRQRQYDYDSLRVEYLYDSNNPPVSFTELAERHGMARSALTDVAVKQGWYQQREEFRRTLGIKVTEQMADKAVQFQIVVREKAMQAGLAYLDLWVKAVNEGTIKPATRDALAVIEMLRLYAGEPEERGGGLYDPSNPPDLAPGDFRKALQTLEQLESGHEQDDADGLAPTGTSGAGGD